jgi:hypothetical protein
VPTRIELARFGAAPIDDPNCYPGSRPDCSYLFCGDHLLTAPIDFDAELAALGVPRLSERRAVLAYGSNACPAQLQRKFASAACSSMVPMTRAWATNLAVGFSNHVTRYGAVPATIFVSEGTRTEVFVAWLDDEQFDVMDRSEARNYERRPFDLAVHPLDVADCPTPTVVDVYVSTRGLLSYNGTTPAVKGIDTTYTGPLFTQAEAKARHGRTATSP